MDLIISILDNDLVSRCCLIAHLIPRDPSVISYSDSSSHVAGRYSTDLQFQWHLQWLESIQACAAKACTQDTININALEYAAIIINYVATTTTILSAPQDHDPYPTALFFTDNIASEAWIFKGAKQSPAGKALGSIQCALMINNPVGINADCMSTNNNIVADCISQFPNNNDPLPHFLTLLQDFPQQTLPPKSQASLHNLGCIIAGEVARSKGTKPATTRLAWQEHFLAFYCSMQINNLCANLPQPVSQNYFLACYAVSLNHGKTISGTPSNPALSKTTSMRRVTFSLPSVTQHHIPAKPPLSTLSCACFGTTNQSPNTAT